MQTAQISNKNRQRPTFSFHLLNQDGKTLYEIIYLFETMKA